MAEVLISTLAQVEEMVIGSVRYGDVLFDSFSEKTKHMTVIKRNFYNFFPCCDLSLLSQPPDLKGLDMATCCENFGVSEGHLRLKDAPFPFSH